MNIQVERKAYELLGYFPCRSFYLLNIWWLTMLTTGFTSNCVLEDFGLALYIYKEVKEIVCSKK